MSELYKLTDIVRFIGGSQPPKSVFSDTKKDGYVRLIQIRDYKSDNHIVYINKDSTKKFCTEDDIMIGRYGPPVFQILRGIEGAYNVALMKAEPKTDKLSKEYLYRFLQNPSIQNYIIGLSQRSAGQSGVNKEALEQYEMLLPSLSEQKRIVSKLDTLFEKIDKAISLHQKNIDEANVFMASVLNDVFVELEEKYEIKILGNLTKTTSGGTPSRSNKSFWGGSIGWLKSGELNDGYITEVEEFITEDGLNKSSAKLFPIGTLLIAMYGATVGKLGILEIETTTNQAICGILNDKNQFETMYMFYFLKKIREKMLKDSFGGAQPNISQTYIKDLELPLPNMQTQQKVVAYLDEISQKLEKIKQLQKEKMEHLKALKASILDKAFRGEL